VGHMIFMGTMAGQGLMGIVVPMGQQQRQMYKGGKPSDYEWIFVPF
jgi:hypothetical protein